MSPTRPAHRPLPLAVLAALALLSPSAIGAQGIPAVQPARITPVVGEFVATTRINVREQPSTRAGRIDLIEGGNRLRVIGKVADAPWYRVVTQSGRTGFVSAELLKAVAASPDPTASAPAPAAFPTDPSLLERLDKLQARLDAIEQRLSALPDPQGFAERGKDDASRLEALDSAITAAKGLMGTLSELQDRIATRFDEQHGEFDRIGDRLKSVEEAMRPTIDWTRQWKDSAAPLTGEAHGWLSGWLSTTGGTVYDWVGNWLPWGARPQPPGPKVQAPQ